MLSRLPGAEVVFVAEQAGPVRTDTRALTLVAERALADVDACDVVVVPGGPGTREMLEPQPLHEWLRAIDATTSGRRRCAPARSCWVPPGCSTASRPRPTGRPSTRWRPWGGGRRNAVWYCPGQVVTAAGVSAGSTWRCGWRPDRRRRGRQGDPAGHRVRPAAALRQRFGRQGLARDHGAGAPGDVVATNKRMNRCSHRGSMGTWPKLLPSPRPPHRPTT